MTFISYAQNFEDVMLWRALKHIKNGFYIDVGANDPEVDSVTKAFYDLGWSGINIEPLSLHFEDLCSVRSRDINLRIAAGEQQGRIELWECEVRGWATASKDVVAMHEANGHLGHCHEVIVSPLKNICEAYAPKDIHFLKIDVEGFEGEVLRGMDFVRYRPWIVVVESTKPNSKCEVHFKWEEVLTSNGYLFAYADGLNRFYLATERQELLPLLRYPPNFFDGFVSSIEVRAETRAQQAETRAQQAETKAQQADSLQVQATIQLNAMYASLSWRITAPLRFLADLFLHPAAMLRSGLNQFAYRLIELGQRPLSRLMAAVLRRPVLRARINQLLMKYPSLYRHLLSVASRQGVLPGAAATSSLPSQAAIAPNLVHMPPRARQIYGDLQRAVENKHRAT